MNRPKKTKIAAVKQVLVRLLLRGYEPELEPAAPASSAEPSAAALLLAGHRKLVKHLEKVARAKEKWSTRVHSMSEKTYKQWIAHDSMVEWLDRMSSKRRVVARRDIYPSALSALSRYDITCVPADHNSPS